MTNKLLNEQMVTNESGIIVLTHVNAVSEEVWDNLLNNEKTIIINEYKDELIFCHISDLKSFDLGYDISGAADTLEDILNEEMSDYVFSELTYKYIPITIYERELTEKMPEIIHATINRMSQVFKEELFSIDFIHNFQVEMKPILFMEISNLLRKDADNYLKKTLTAI